MISAEAYFEDLLGKVIEGVANEEEFATFMEIVRRDADLRVRYVKDMRIHAILSFHEEKGGERSCVEGHSQQDGKRKLGKREGGWRVAAGRCWKVAAAVVVLLGGAAVWYELPLPRESTAVLPVAPVLLIGQSGVSGLDLPESLPGLLRLSSGEAVVKLQSGVELTVIGPVEVAVRDCMQVRLESGRLLANVPHWATGFTVRTAELEVYDLGTIFSVSVTSGVSEVFVFKGSVQVNEAGYGEEGRTASGSGVGVCEAGEGVRAVSGESPAKIAADWPEAQKLFGTLRAGRALESPAKTFETATRIADLWAGRYMPRLASGALTTQGFFGRDDVADAQKNTKKENTMNIKASMTRLATAALLGAGAGAANAADRVWTGGGSDAYWSTAANWDTGTPVAGDALSFAGSAKLANTNDLAAGTAFSGITFQKGAGAFSLSGNAVTLDGDIRSQATTATVALPLTLSGDRLCLASNASVTLSGVISGPGGLRFEGQSGSTVNAFALSGDNTFEGPVVLTNRTTLTVSTPTALGSTAAGTTVYGGSTTSLRLSGGITLAEPITLNWTDNVNWWATLQGVSGTNVLTGPVFMFDGSVIQADANRTLIVRGGIIQTDKGAGKTVFLKPQSGAQLIVTNRPLFVVSTVPIEVQGGGQLVLAEPGNTYGRLLIELGSTVRTDAPNALSPYGTLEFGLYATDNKGGTLDLNGFSQTVGPLKTAAVGLGRMAVTSAVPATLTVIQRAASVFRGDIAGAVSLVKMGDYTLTFTNAAPMTTTGSVTVASGTLELGNNVGSPGGFGAAPVVRVLPGGTLAVNNGSSLPDAAEVSVLGTGKLDIQTSVTETVCKLFLDGVQQVDGTWGRTGSGADHINDAFFTGGTGKLLVTDGPGATVYADATWDDGGATNLLTAQANWVGDTLPAFAGSERAVFGTAGSAAGIDTAASFYKLTVNRDANFNLTDLGGSLTLGRGGIEAGLAGTARSHTITAPVSLGDDQFLFVTNSTLYVENTLSDGGRGAGLTLSGGGTVYLDGDNTYGGKTTVRAKSTLYVKHSHALGNAVGDTLIEDGGYFKLDAGYGNGITVEDPILLTGDVTTGYGGTIRNSSGTNVLSGPITAYSSQTRIQNSGGTLDIIGGITADANGAKFVIATGGSGVITRLREKPVFAHHFYASDWSGGTFIFAVSGNVTRLCYLNGSVRLDTPNAFHYLGNLMIGADGGATTVADVDLNGYDLTACQLSTPALFSYARMFSEAPATLTVDQSVNSTYGGSFTGALSVVKLGAGNLTLTNQFTTTSGSVAVSGGTLTVSNYGSLGPNCTNIVVAGDGTLALAHANASILADTATVRLPAAGVGTARISLVAGVDETVGWLFCGDRLMYPGTYGATGSDARYVDDTRFSGNGVLRVAHGTATGTLIRVN